MRVLITGGAGYVGSALVPTLIAKGHRVGIYDTFWFGDHSPRNAPGVSRFPGDIRNTADWRMALRTFEPDAVLHLACISNDPSFELDESLSRTINFECFEPLVVAAKELRVRRFIYCSTSSVYGVSDAPDVREDHPLVPLTLYNTYKAKCEPLLFKHQADDFICATIRPSTICGYAPRQRLDLAVNILTNLAINKGEITVFGGEQRRPNLHIKDMVRCYEEMLTARGSLINGQTFNVGAKNHTIMELAEIVRAVVENMPDNGYNRIEIKRLPIQDTRSYQVNSDKIRDVLGFTPQYSVAQAVLELCLAFKAKLLPNPLTDPIYYNVKRMHAVWADLYKDAPPSKFDPTKGHLSEIDVHHRGVEK